MHFVSILASSSSHDLDLKDPTLSWEDEGFYIYWEYNLLHRTYGLLHRTNTMLMILAPLMRDSSESTHSSS